MRDELRERMLQLREGCECGDRRAYVRLGIIIGENRERRAAWRRTHPEVPPYASVLQHSRRDRPGAPAAC